MVALITHIATVSLRIKTSQMICSRPLILRMHILNIIAHLYDTFQEQPSVLRTILEFLFWWGDKGTVEASFDRIVPDGSGLSVVMRSIVYIFKLLLFERVTLYDSCNHVLRLKREGMMNIVLLWKLMIIRNNRPVNERAWAALR